MPQLTKKGTCQRRKKTHRERKSGARRRRPQLHRLASPRRPVREHIAREGEGALSGRMWPPATSYDVAWIVEDAAVSDELRRGAWMTEDAAVVDEL
uniref:Uncharacterized protein n=1 Tax=Oryza rufipogon TaxID=4529 RepID=A0A0E0NBQ1_ORYRU